MFGWLFRKEVKEIEISAKQAFENVKKDFEATGKWIKHLDQRDKELTHILEDLKSDIEDLRNDVAGLKEALSLMNMPEEIKEEVKQPYKKLPVLNSQPAVYPVQEPVQTGVQTANLYQILQDLSANERLIIWTLLNAGEGMKLSYEDIARLLGKERSTIRGQINTIRQKSEGILNELTEASGKKRVYIPEEVRVKLLKYAKVRVGKEKKGAKKEVKEKENGQ